MTDHSLKTRRKVDKDNAFAMRFYAWIQERFPLSQGLLFFVLYMAAITVGRGLSGGGPILLSGADIPGFVAVWGFFLLLRVFDEHKDYRKDLHNHPERVLQSGLITLDHLKRAAVISIALQAGVSVWLDRGIGPISLAWIGVMFWSTLMAQEFFVGPWLEKRLALYAFAHMLVMPITIVWIARMGANGQWLNADVGILGLIAFCSGAAFEVTRKTRAPSEERETVDSYARSLGLKTACGAIAVFLILSAAAQICLLVRILGSSLAPGWQIALILVPLAPILKLILFSYQPTPAGRASNELVVALAMLCGYLLLTLALLYHRGMPI